MTISTMKLRFAIQALFLISFVIGLQNAWSSDLQRSRLKGLDGVNVIIYDMQRDIEHTGLTETQLKTDVELKLRKANIRVLHDSLVGVPNLYVMVHAIETDDLISVVYSIRVQVNDFVLLLRSGQNFLFGEWMDAQLEQAIESRSPSLAADAIRLAAEHGEFYASIWDRSYVGIVPLSKAQSKIRAIVSDFVDGFMNDYLAAND